MKQRACLAVLAFIACGCTAQHGEELTQQQKDQIVSEVRVVGDSLMAHWARLDGPGTLAFYANTPHWVMFNADGTQWDYETTRRVIGDTAGNTASWKYATIRQDFWVVNKDLVLCAWVIKDQFVMKSGDSLSTDPHPYTVIFQRIGGQWKVVWSQDSGVPVIHKAAAAHRR